MRFIVWTVNLTFIAILTHLATAKSSFLLVLFPVTGKSFLQPNKPIQEPPLPLHLVRNNVGLILLDLLRAHAQKWVTADQWHWLHLCWSPQLLAISLAGEEAVSFSRWLSKQRQTPPVAALGCGGLLLGKWFFSLLILILQFFPVQSDSLSF